MTEKTRMLLQGLKVVEMSTWIAAPGAAMIMGEWGAGAECGWRGWRPAR